MARVRMVLMLSHIQLLTGHQGLFAGYHVGVAPPAGHGPSGRNDWLTTIY